MARRDSAIPGADDPTRTVRVRRADGDEFYVTPEVARFIENQGGEILGGAARTDDSKAAKAAVADLEKQVEELKKEIAARDELLTLVPTSTVAELEQLAAATKE